MVSAAENLTALTGHITARSPHPSLKDWDVVSLTVDRTVPIAGKADLLSQSATGAMDVAVRRALLGGASIGDRLSARVSLTPSGPMAEPHPSEGDFAVESA